MGWIETFAKHRIAANGAMILIIASGIWGLNQVNNQFFPDFGFDRVSVSATWGGVSAEDMYRTVAIPLQQALVGLPEIDSISTSANSGRVGLWISLSDRAESLSSARDIIETAVNAVELPEPVDDLRISSPQRRENVADLLIYGEVPADELADLAYKMESQLLQAGFAQINLQGIPRQQVQIEVSTERLLDTGLTLAQIASAIGAEYTAQPAGTSTGDALTLQLLSQTPNIDFASLYDLIVTTLDDGSALRLGDIAQIERVVNRNSNALYFEGTPAIRLSLMRTPGEDTLDNAETMQTWLTTFTPTLPASVQIHVYNETWQIVAAQLRLLLKNGALGMGLVLVMLFFFLNSRLAFWVAMGIPISFFATFLFMAQAGVSMNTISLFGFMIALGIIVDDAIVVGEQARAYQQQGMSASAASLQAAKKMWPPVLASSLTTMAAFLPLMLISGPIGQLARDIPIIVSVAIVASLVECFLILPGHLSHSHHKKDRPVRQKLDAAFNRVRDNWFRPIVRWSLTHRPILMALILANLILAIGMVSSKMVPFQFQPSVESPSLSVSVTFAEGVLPSKVDAFIDQLTQTLQAVEDKTGYDFIKTALVIRNQGDQANRARIDVELISDQDRPYTNQELVNQWRAATTLPSEIDNISFGRGNRWGGESGDIVIALTGENIDTLKSAALALQGQLSGVPGLSDAIDSLPYGDEQLQFELTPLARDLGISEASIAGFLRQAIEGVSAADQVAGLQTLNLRVLLPERQRSDILAILSLPFALNDELIPLDDLMISRYQRGLDGIRAQDGEISVNVSATLDAGVMTSDGMYSLLDDTVLPGVRADYGTLEVSLSGDARGQREFFADATLVLIGVLALIYGILAWVFESWVWPFAILVAIPFGLTGAIYGHWLIDLPLSSLSVLGLFGLSGIVINDSIVLISVYRDLRRDGMPLYEALEEAVASRLRPVLLTTLTTVGGLTPFLFETSLDAQFLKPIAAGLVFGLLFATVLILLFVPAMLLTLEQLIERFNRLKRRWSSAE
jgi:multidrug efflux pump subunit AcrB